MPTNDRLELIDVVTVGRRHLVHVFYDRSFQGAIHEAECGWRAKLHPVDLGDFHGVAEAREAVAKWFAEIEANSFERESEEGAREPSDRAELLGEDSTCTNPMDHEERCA